MNINAEESMPEIKPVIKIRPSIEYMVAEMQEEIQDWGVEFKSQFFLGEYTSNETSLHTWHHSLGRFIRNKFQLYSYPWTAKVIDGFDESNEHPDAISMSVIEELWKQGPINVKKDT